MVIDENGYQEWKAERQIPRWIGWPKKDLFHYDEAVYKRLRGLYEESRLHELNQEWKNLSPVK